MGVFGNVCKYILNKTLYLIKILYRCYINVFIIFITIIFLTVSLLVLILLFLLSLIYLYIILPLWLETIERAKVIAKVVDARFGENTSINIYITVTFGTLILLGLEFAYNMFKYYGVFLFLKKQLICLSNYIDYYTPFLRLLGKFYYLLIFLKNYTFEIFKCIYLNIHIYFLNLCIKYLNGFRFIKGKFYYLFNDWARLGKSFYNFLYETISLIVTSIWNILDIIVTNIIDFIKKYF